MLEEISDLKWIPYFLVFLFVFNPAFGDSNFSNIQRMVQFDSSGISYGCRGSSISYKEARSLNSINLVNGCILARFQDITIDQYRELRNKASGLIVLLPKNIRDLTAEEKENIFLLEQAMLAEEISIPVYFSQYDEQIDRIISEIQVHPMGKAAPKQSAMSDIFKKISANSYQVVVTGSHSPKKDSRIPIIQGELIPFKQSSSDQQTKLPVIVISTQMKPFGITNDQPPNYDATILLTLMSIFSKLYNHVSSSAKYRIVFVLDESGSLLNFQGAKKWLETNVEENVHNIEFAICLEAFGEAIGDIFMHVSKPPKEGTAVHRFYEILEKKTKKHSEKTLENIHKKINLADTYFKFPHERFSMKRVSAFTLSTLRNYADPLKTSTFVDHASTTILNSESELDPIVFENIETNVKILAESLASFIFNFNSEEDEEIFSGSMAITRKTIQPHIAPKSLSKSNNVKLAFEKLLKNVKVTYDISTDRDPDFVFYDGDEAKLNIYNVKPAVFDLFLTSVIGCYLFAIYFVIIHFPKIYGVISKLAFNPASSTTNVATTNGVHKVKAN